MTGRFCVCPYCGRRWSGEVDPDCLICAGEGVLELGAAGVARCGAEVTALAVERALDTRARDALVGMNAREPMGMLQARASLALCVLQLRRAGLLARRPQDRAALAQLGRSLLAVHQPRSSVSAGEWRPADRPRGGGGGRGFDLAFHLCSLQWVPAVEPLTDADQLQVSSWASAWA